jgi:hypothetical protein
VASQSPIARRRFLFHHYVVPRRSNFVCVPASVVFVGSGSLFWAFIPVIADFRNNFGKLLEERICLAKTAFTAVVGASSSRRLWHA